MSVWSNLKGQTTLIVQRVPVIPTYFGDALINTCIALTSNDVTINHRVEQAKRATQNELHAIGQAKGKLLSMAAHELRTPLNAIIGFSDLLRTMDHVPNECLEYVDDIHTAGMHLLNIVNDLLDYSKAEANTSKSK